MQETILLNPKLIAAPAGIRWEEITDPGAYVEIGTGDLYRIPQEALLRIAIPSPGKVSATSSRFVLISDNPYVTLLEARKLVSDQRIEPNLRS